MFAYIVFHLRSHMFYVRQRKLIYSCSLYVNEWTHLQHQKRLTRLCIPNLSSAPPLRRTHAGHVTSTWHPLRMSDSQRGARANRQTRDPPVPTSAVTPCQRASNKTCLVFCVTHHAFRAPLNVHSYTWPHKLQSS